MARMTIDGITYEARRHAVSDIRVKFPRVAAELEQKGVVAELQLSRPRGRHIYIAYENAAGQIGKVTQLA